MQTKVFVDPAPCTEAVLAVPVPEDLTAQFEQPDVKRSHSHLCDQVKSGAGSSPTQWPWMSGVLVWLCRPLSLHQFTELC